MKYSVLLFALFFFFQLQGQVSQVEFGKNRIQYHDDFDQWLSYESQNFITYWYGNSRNAGHKAVQIAESVYEDINSHLEYRINDKIELIVYVDITDAKQSNIGSEEIVMGRTGQTRIERNKIFVHFDGDFRNFRKQIREGIAAVFINYMLFGSEIQEILQNIVALGLPDWFIQGLTSYIGEPWSIETDNALRDALSKKAYKNFDQFAKAEPKLAGQAFWLYIDLNFGRAEISNLLYVIRINRNLENGIAYVFGQNYKSLAENTWIFMQQLNGTELPLIDSLLQKDRLPIKNRRKIPYSHVKLHPQAPILAYTSNNEGRTKVMLYDTEAKRRKTIFTNSYKNTLQATDYNYPLISWSPSGNTLAILYERRDRMYLILHDIKTGKKEKQVVPNRFQRIYSLDWWDENSLLFSAGENVYTDLYIYRLRNRQSTQLTDDIFDDRYAIAGMYKNREGIFFSSTRRTLVNEKNAGETIIPFKTFNIFFLPYDEPRDSFIQITRNDASDHTHLSYTSNGALHFLSNENGIVNRMKLDLMSGETSPVFQSNYPRNIIAMDANFTTNSLAEIINFQGKPMILQQKLSDQVNQNPGKTVFYELYKASAGQATKGPGGTSIKGLPFKAPPLKPIQIDSIIETNPDYFFVSPFGDMPKEEKSMTLIPEFKLNERESSSENVSSTGINPAYERINPLRVVPYRLRFRIDYVTTNLDNEPLFGGLESYAGLGEVRFNNPMGILFKANFKDLFEDYQMEGGIRIPTTFNGAEYFLFLDDKKSRLDKRYALYRRTNARNEGFIGNITIRSRTEILLGQFQVRYPLDVFTSLRAIATLRRDKFTYLASEPNSLNEPPTQDQRLGGRLEYVFDNSMAVDVNILNGTRYKIYTEFVKKFQIQLLDGLKFDLAQGFLGIVGFDARHYIPIGKHGVFAIRAAGATSFGSEKILYLLGGSDNWITPRFNDNIPLPSGDDFAFQTTTPNLRGFDFNIRNGNSFALLNFEARLPIFKYLINRPIRSTFIRHFQVVGFFDMGTAWQGISPFNRENPLNTIYIENPPTVFVKVNYFRDPIVMGYGVGLRTMLFGYFIRADYGWGVETKQVLKPKFHLALGMDF